MSAPVIYYIYTLKKKQQKEKYNHLYKNNQKKAEQTKQKVYKVIEELKRKNEKITIRKVKELAKVSLTSANKYVKQAKKEGIIQV
jgi:Fic family protein